MGLETEPIVTGYKTALFSALMAAMLFCGCGSGGGDTLPTPPSLVQDNIVYELHDGGNTATWVGRWTHMQPFNNDRPVLVLIAGITYDKGTYWTGLPDYSFTDYMQKKGYDTLVLDMRSANMVDGFWPTPDRAAALIGKAARSMRDKTYKTVIGVGHSIGAAEMIYYTGSFGQMFDKIVVTGYTNISHPLPPIITKEALRMVLAQHHPVYPDFLRTALFYYKDGSDPTIADLDNSQLASDTLNGRLRPTFQTENNGPLYTRDFAAPEKVRVPVLVVLGDKDILYPPDMVDMEIAAYSSSPKVTAVIQPNSGHSLNFHENRKTGWEAINTWLQ